MKCVKLLSLDCPSIAITGCVSKQPPHLHVEASSENQWTGVAVSKERRTFVNFPYWSGDVRVDTEREAAFTTDSCNVANHPFAQPFIDYLVADKTGNN